MPWAVGKVPHGPVALGSAGQAPADPVRLSQKFKPPPAAMEMPPSAADERLPSCLMPAEGCRPFHYALGADPAGTGSLGQGRKAGSHRLRLPRRRARPSRAHAAEFGVALLS